jgi:hypothetical protein
MLVPAVGAQGCLVLARVLRRLSALGCFCRIDSPISYLSFRLEPFPERSHASDKIIEGYRAHDKPIHEPYRGTRHYHSAKR